MKRNAALTVFRQIAAAQHCPAGQELFRQGEPLRAVYLIEAGLVRMTRLEHDGDERPIEFRMPGLILGAASVLSGNPALLTAVTATECELIMLPVATFRRLVKSEAVLSHYLLAMLSQQYYEQVIREAQMKNQSARARVASLLLQCLPEAKQNETTDIRLALPASHQDLAGFLLMSPEHFSRMLREMEDEGIIRREKGWIIVSRLEQLVQEAEVRA